MVIRVAVVGATGRMGRLALSLIAESDDLVLHAALDSRSKLTECAGADVVLDVTHPSASGEIVDYAVARGIPIVVGTSGWSEERIARVRVQVAVRDSHWDPTPDAVVGDGMAGDAASGADGAELRGNPSHGVTGEGPERSGGVIFVPNFSLGSVVGTVLAAYGARFFDSVEIVESHHAGKADSPSGTAVRTAERIAATREAVGPISAPHPEQRARGELVSGVPIHSMRLAGVDAEQRIVFGGVGDTLTFVHTTVSSVAYRAGLLLALRAAPVTPGVMVGLETLLGLDLSGVDEGL